MRTAMLMALAVGAGACSDDGPSDPAPADGDGPSGFVARQKTGVGIENVVIVATASTGSVAATTWTGPDGAFAFDALPDGDYTLTLANTSAAGIDDRFEAIEPAALTVRVGSDPDSDLVFAVVGLVPARIAGDVTCDGAPVPGASIRVVGGVTDATVTTNPQGRYAALDLAPGKYTVIPGALPCSTDEGPRVVEVLLGQFVEVDFTGGGG